MTTAEHFALGLGIGVGLMVGALLIGLITTLVLEAVRQHLPASVDTLPKGQDAKQGLAGAEGSAVPKADAQTPQPSK